MFIGTMEQLKEKAIKIEEGTEAFFPLQNSTEELSTAWVTPAYVRRYAYNGGIVSFIDEKMDWYVIPDIGVQEFLAKYTYVKTDFYVPFSVLLSSPVKEAEKWKALLEEFKNHQ